MPIYVYHCPANAQTVEVRHGMTERITTWQQLCARAEHPLGTTPPHAAVEREITAAHVGANRTGAITAPTMCPCGQLGGCRAS